MSTIDGGALQAAGSSRDDGTAELLLHAEKASLRRADRLHSRKLHVTIRPAVSFDVFPPITAQLQSCPHGCDHIFLASRRAARRSSWNSSCERILDSTAKWRRCTCPATLAPGGRSHSRSLRCRRRLTPSSVFLSSGSVPTGWAASERRLAAVGRSVLFRAAQCRRALQIRPPTPPSGGRTSTSQLRSGADALQLL